MVSNYYSAMIFYLNALSVNKPNLFRAPLISEILASSFLFSTFCLNLDNSGFIIIRIAYLLQESLFPR